MFFQVEFSSSRRNKSNSREGFDSFRLYYTKGREYYSTFKTNTHLYNTITNVLIGYCFIFIIHGHDLCVLHIRTYFHRFFSCYHLIICLSIQNIHISCFRTSLMISQQIEMLQLHIIYDLLVQFN